MAANTGVVDCINKLRRSLIASSTVEGNLSNAQEVVANAVLHDDDDEDNGDSIFGQALTEYKDSAVLCKLAPQYYSVLSQVVEGLRQPPAGNNKTQRKYMASVAAFLRPLMAGCLAITIPFVIASKRDLLDGNEFLDYGQSLENNTVLCLNKFCIGGRSSNTKADGGDDQEVSSRISELLSVFKNLPGSRFSLSAIPATSLLGMFVGIRSQGGKCVGTLVDMEVPTYAEFCNIVAYCCRILLSPQRSTGVIEGYTAEATCVRVADGFRGAVPGSKLCDIYHVVMRDRCTDAALSDLSEAFATRAFSSVRDTCAKAGVERLDGLYLDGNRRKQLLEKGAGAGGANVAADSANDKVWLGGPEANLFTYKPGGNDPNFSLLVVNNALSKSFYGKMWDSIDRHPVIWGEGGRKDSLMYLTAQQQSNIPATSHERAYYAIGSSGKITLYPNCRSPISVTDKALLEITTGMLDSINDSVQAHLNELSPGRGKRHFSFGVNVLFNLIAPSSNISWRGKGHNDPDMTNSRLSSESYYDTFLPNQDCFMAVTWVGVNPKYIGTKQAATRLEYRRCGGEGNRVIQPDGDSPSHWMTEKNPSGVSMEGNTLHIQSFGAQRQLHLVELCGKDPPKDLIRCAIGARFIALPTSHSTGEESIPRLPPSLDSRLALWKKQSAISFFRAKGDYRLHPNRGNFATLLAVRVADRNDYVSELDRGNPTAEDDSASKDVDEERHPEKNKRDSSIYLEAGIEASKVDCMMNAPEPFNLAEDVTLPNFEVTSNFPQGVAMLNSDVVMPLYYKMGFNVRRSCIDESGKKNGLHIDELYRENDFLMREGEVYSVDRVKLAAGLTAKPSCPATKLLSTDLGVSNIMVVSRFYKNQLESVLASLAMSIILRDRKTADDADLRSIPAGVTPLKIYGSGGSAVLASSAQADVSKLNWKTGEGGGSVLTLQHGQKCYPLAHQVSLELWQGREDCEEMVQSVEQRDGVSVTI